MKNTIFEIVCGNDVVFKSGGLTHIPLAAASFEQVTDGDNIRANYVFLLLMMFLQLGIELQVSLNG